MKTVSKFILMGFFTISIISCTNANKQNDSVKQAEKSTDQAFKSENNKESVSDADFIVLAYNSAITEIKMGEITQTNALDNAVKEMGTSAIRDYSTMKETLETFANKNNISLPKEVSKISNKAITEIENNTGNVFDRAYAKTLIDIRVKETRIFEKAEKKTIDPLLKAFISDSMPLIRTNLEAAEKLKAQIPYY